MTQIGPGHSSSNRLFNRFNTPTYLRGHATKIKTSIESYLRLYSGREIVIFRSDTEAGKCTVCIDAFTGAKILSSGCPACNGSGWVGGYIKHGPYWALMDIAPKNVDGSELGNIDTPTTGGKDTATICGADQIMDGDLVGLVDTQELYIVQQMEPQFSAIGGIVVLQTVPLAYITPGAPAYSQVTW